MYNSVTVRFLNRIYLALSHAYQSSVTHKFFKGIGDPIKRACANSNLNTIINGTKYIFRDSYFLKIYKGFFALIERFMHFLHRILVEPIKHTFFLGDTFEILSDFDEVMGFVSNIILWSGILVTIVAIIFRAHIKFGIAVVIFGFIMSTLKGKYLAIIKNSKALEFILSFFELDKGGEAWW